MLNVGDIAPNFTLHGANGEITSLSDFYGEKVLLCFLKDLRSGMSAVNLYASIDWIYDEFNHFHVVPICICPTNEKVIERFYSEVPIQTRLLYDYRRMIARRYQVEGERVTFGKKYHVIQESAFVIDELGRIEQCFKRFAYESGHERVITYLKKHTCKTQTAMKY